MLSCHQPCMTGRYYCHGRQALMKIHHVIHTSSWCIKLETIELILGRCYEGYFLHFPYHDCRWYIIQTLCLRWPGYIVSAVKCKILKPTRIVKSLIVMQKAMLEFNPYSMNEYHLILTKHQYSNIGSPGIFNLCVELFSDIAIFETYLYISKWG